MVFDADNAYFSETESPSDSWTGDEDYVPPRTPTSPAGPRHIPTRVMVTLDPLSDDEDRPESPCQSPIPLPVAMRSRPLAPAQGRKQVIDDTVVIVRPLLAQYRSTNYPAESIHGQSPSRPFALNLH